MRTADPGQDVIAIDVVLRPDAAGEDLAIRLSESLRPESPFTLNRIDRLPHCSLFMAHVATSDIDRITDQLAPIAAAQRSLVVQAQFETYPSQSPPPLTTGIEIERIPELQELHERIVTALRSFGGRPVASDAYVLDPTESEVRPKSIEWTKQYLTDASCERFHPHITLGKGEPTAPIEWPVSMTLNRLALCQLGNWNTCRKLLAEWPCTQRK